MSLRHLEMSGRRHAVWAALIAATIWVLLTLLVLFMPHGINPAGAIPAGVKIYIALVVGVLVVPAIPLELIGERHITNMQSERAQDRRLINVAEEIAIGTGHKPGTVLIHESSVPNVGGFPTTDGVIVVATSGAVELLSRDELQALVATQFAGMEDPWCRLATKAEFAWGTALIASVLSLIVSPVGWILILGAVLPRSVEHHRDLCADIAAVRAARHPEALSSALRSLRPAAPMSNKLQMGSHGVSASPFLVLPTRQPSTTWVGERSFTSTDEIATELTLRADRADALAAGGDPTQFTSREYRRRYNQLGTEPDLNEAGSSETNALTDTPGAPKHA